MCHLIDIRTRIIIRTREIRHRANKRKNIAMIIVGFGNFYSLAMKMKISISRKR